MTDSSGETTDERASDGADPRLAPNQRWLLTGRALRSFATSYLTVIFPLYLAARGESAGTIGIVLAAGSACSAVLTAGVGIFGDRYGRKPLLVALAILGAVGALGLAWSPRLAVIILASGIGGIGRGGNAGSGGAWGPFFPAEQPLLAASVPARLRTRAFGRLGFVGVIGATLGSLMAGLPRLLEGPGSSLVDGDRILFVIAAVVSLGVAVASSLLVEPRRPPRSPRPISSQPGPLQKKTDGGLGTRTLIGRLGVTNGLNGFGLGFLGPLLTYWFYVRFHVGAAELGLLYTGVNIASALPFLGAARLTRRFGSVRTVVITRGMSVAVLLAMAVAPTFAVAGALLSLRMALNSFGLPARQSYVMAQADESRRGTVAAMGQLPSVVTSSVSPAVGGALVGVFQDTPIFGGALFMGANTLAYYLSFRHAPPSDERTDPATPLKERVERALPSHTRTGETVPSDARVDHRPT